MTAETTTVGPNVPATLVDLYFYAETRGGKLRRLSNAAADVADRAMAMGYEESAFVEYAEMADELAALADFIEPSPSWTIWNNEGVVSSATQ
jgi:hypothetical protein